MASMPPIFTSAFLIFRMLACLSRWRLLSHLSWPFSLLKGLMIGREPSPLHPLFLLVHWASFTGGKVFQLFLSEYFLPFIHAFLFYCIMQVLWWSSPICSNSVCSMRCNTCDGDCYSTDVYTFKLLAVGSRLMLFLLSIAEMDAFLLFV